MTNKQSSFYTTLRRVLAFLIKNAALFKELAIMEDLTTRLETYLGEIDILKEQQGTDITGLSKQKGVLRKTAIQKAIEVAKSMLVYANLTGDEVLSKAVSYTETYLKVISDNDLDTALSVIYTAAKNNQAALVTYGVTAEKVTSLKTAIDAFKASMGSPKDGTISKKQITEQLGNLFDNEAEILDNIDLLMDTFKFTNPALYAEYLSNRKIETRTGSLTLKAVITDSETGLTLPGVKVVFSLDDEVVLEKTTASAGGLNVKSLAEGIYSLTLSKSGYQTQTQLVNVSNDELNVVQAAMVKVILMEKLKS